MREYIVGREESYSGSGILYERISRESLTMEKVAQGSVSALRDLAKKLNAAEER